jgi:hypothetical protein
VSKIPKYRKLTKRSKAFVEYNRKRIYFPRNFNSAESRTAYAKFIEDITKAELGDVGEISIKKLDTVPISLLCIQFLDWAKMRYVKHGRSTGSYERFRDYIRPFL